MTVGPTAAPLPARERPDTNMQVTGGIAFSAPTPSGMSVPDLRVRVRRQPGVQSEHHASWWTERRGQRHARGCVVAFCRGGRSTKMAVVALNYVGPTPRTRPQLPHSKIT